ncbi:hypothetical protein M432DRAFT_258141 [Thermoascus aurantiacus ATCC 26904]
MFCVCASLWKLQFSRRLLWSHLLVLVQIAPIGSSLTIVSLDFWELEIHQVVSTTTSAREYLGFVSKRVVLLWDLSRSCGPMER